MQNYERKIKLKFGVLASFYDLFDICFLLDKKRNPRHALARKIPNKALRILDVCVGTANSAIAVAEANNRNEIVGIDLSADMIAVAEGKIKKRGIHNISVRQMDAARMDFQDGEFDVAMVSFGLHELGYELMINVLKEMGRVLKGAGRLYIVDYERESSLIKNLVLSVFLKIFEPKHMPEFLRYDWDEILRRVGFQEVAVERCLFSKLVSATKQSGSASGKLTVVEDDDAHLEDFKEYMP